jgi:N utilization substance protein B
LQVLFVWDQRKQPIEDAIAAYYLTLGSEEEDPKPTPADDFMEELARGVSRNVAEIDQRITAKASNWRIERMAVVDRNILRLAIYEIHSTATPPAVAIDEALELAHEFAGEESAAFVNGVLDAVRRESA